MIIGKQGCADEHEQCPDGNAHQHADVGGLLRLVVVLGSQVALYDGLVGTILLQGIEDTVEHHHDERQLRQVPVVGTEAYLVVFRRNTESFCRTTINAEQQDADADNATTDEEESLRHVHPDNSLHTTKQCQDNDGDAQHKHDAIDIDVEECRQSHRDKEEYRSCLGEMT